MQNKDKEREERSKKIMKGLELAYKRMIEFKRQKNTPLVVSEDGKVVLIDPHDAPSEVVYK